MNQRRQLLAAGLLIFISRLPFLFDGYGSEEDAWALRLVAENIGRSGIYEVSRLPGHPFQELVYAGIWQGGAVLFNFITAVLSTVGIVYFIKSLQKLEIGNAVLAGFTLAAVPVVYINSTNAMDYTWAMAFILLSFYQLVSIKPFSAGVFLALATGCRITSAVFGLPFLLYIFWFNERQRIKYSFLFALSATVFTLLLFLPVIWNYGMSFFTFYEHFPLPGFAKNLYKGVIAVWGIPMLAVSFIVLVMQWKDRQAVQPKDKKLLLLSALIAVLVILMFARVPLKSAFMIPLVPFVVLAAAIFLSTGRLFILFCSALVSCFLFGVNLDDVRRGSSKSALSLTYIISEQPVVIDALQGLVSADQSKRIRRTAFSREVISKSANLKPGSVVLAGWWLADILVLEKGSAEKRILWRYYMEEDSLHYYQQHGSEIYFLPEQDKLNDLRFKGTFTKHYASPFPLIP